MFVLDNPKSAAKTYVLFLKLLNDGRLKYSTKLKIHPINWNKGRAFPTGPEYVKECAEINQVLDKLQDRFKTIEADKLTKRYVRQALDAVMGWDDEPREKNMVDIIDEIISDREAGRELTKGGILFSYGTIKNYKQTLRKMQEYQDKKEITLYFETFSIEDCNNLLSWLSAEYKMSLSTLGRHIRELKLMFTAARKRKYHNNPVMEDIDNVSEDPHDVYLDEEKILKIYNAETEGIKTWVKEWFVIDCFTGLRISDLTTLSKGKIHNGFLNLPNEKTGERVVIPLHWTVQEILNKYKGHFPPSVSDQKMNKHIKEVAKEAELKDVIFYSQTIAGKRQDFEMFEWQMISNHTGRRSFITNLLKAGFSESEVMKLAGIKESKTLQKYNKISHQEVAKKAADNPFFKKPALKAKRKG